MKHPRLTPIERPENPLMRLAYWLTRRRLGKVISPLKIIHARLPFAFARWSGQIENLMNKLSLPADLVLLIKIHVAQLNTCGFCIDIGKAKALQKFENEEKFFSVRNYQHSMLFTVEEKIALRYAEELTLHKNISDDTFQEAQQYFSERQLVELAWVVTGEHVYNLMNVAFHIESDELCVVPRKGAEAVV
jgi:AhpD family alkylhydroperoxidase